MNPKPPESTPEETALREAVRDAFRDDRIGTATEEELRAWLKALSTTRSRYIKNYSRDIIRAAYINHIQSARLIRNLDNEIRWIHKWILGLTFGLGLLTLALVGLAIQLKNIAKHINDNIGSLYYLAQHASPQW